MKKILLASSALVLVGGVAFAESTVTTTGSAELGIFGGEVGSTDVEPQFHTDINIDFAASATTDGGVEFGAEIGLEEAQGGVATTIEDDFTVFLSSSFGNLTAGDTDGAFDWA
ncbi:MAG: porin, partial [Pseudomonadota bacterium]